MLISEILNREYRLCDFEEREKSVIYKEVDLDSLLLENSMENEIGMEINISKRRISNE